MKKLNRTTCPANEYPIRFIQFGDGNFLRGFIDWMIQEMNEKLDFNTGVAVVQARPTGKIHRLAAQDGLYHLYLKGIKKGELINKHQLIDCIQKTINPYTDYTNFLSLAHAEELRFIVSNTTEAGIFFDENEKIEVAQENFPAKLTALLYERFQTFNGDTSKGLLVLPCELIEDNGYKLEEIVYRYIDLWELPKEFKVWIKEGSTFYNTLVDRIVPGFPKDRIDEVYKELGYQDELVVDGEQFHIFVIEGDAVIEKEFPANKAGLDVVFTNNIDPYRVRKVRILNGLHTTMVSLGITNGQATVKECMDHNKLKKSLITAVYDEIIPSLPPMNGIEKYAEDILERFENPYMVHYLKAISLNSFSKFKTRVLPSILAYQKKYNKSPSVLIRAFSALIILYNPENKYAFIANDDPSIMNFISDLWNSLSKKEIDLEELVISVLKNKNIWDIERSEIDLMKTKLIANIQQEL